MASDEPEIIGPPEENPDTSDLAMVVINVDTRDHRQLAFAVGPELESDVLSMTMEHGYGVDDSGNYENWIIRVKRVSP